MDLSPASVSRHISALEESVGGRLLNRTSRKLTLTEAGEIYFHKVEHILQQILEANESVAQLQSVPRGTLRVHSRMLVGHQYIVPALPDFMKQYPDIIVDLLLSNHAVDLVEQNIDIDIRIGKLVELLADRPQAHLERAHRVRDAEISRAQRRRRVAERPGGAQLPDLPAQSRPHGLALQGAGRRGDRGAGDRQVPDRQRPGDPRRDTRRRRHRADAGLVDPR